MVVLVVVVVVIVVAIVVLDTIENQPARFLEFK